MEPVTYRTLTQHGALHHCLSFAKQRPFIEWVLALDIDEFLWVGGRAGAGGASMGSTNKKMFTFSEWARGVPQNVSAVVFDDFD